MVEKGERTWKVATGLSMSLDGFIAGPNDGPERPLGEGGWLKALQLAEYASRKPQQPQALQQAPSLTPALDCGS